MRSEEARGPALVSGVVAQAEQAKNYDADDDQDAEEILEETDNGPGADNRNPEVGDEQRAVCLENGQAEDEESPKGEHVGDTRDGPLQQLLLSEYLGGFGGHARGGVDEATNGRFARAAEGDQEPQALAGKGQDDDRDSEADDEPDQLMGIHVQRLSIVGQTSGSISAHVTSLSAVANVIFDLPAKGTHGHLAPPA